MKTQLFKIISILLLTPIVIFANNVNKGRYKKKKSISKEYAVNADALVKINNRYGNVDIATWNENRVVFEIEITVSGNDEQRVINKLDNINVSFSGANDLVTAKTIINKSNTTGWFSWFSNNNSNLNYKINYTVKMPKSNDLTVYNDYGSIYLNELDGKANINCDYGKVVLGALNNTDNLINTDYSKNSTIEFIKGGRINADYSGFTVDAAKNIDLNADYSSSKFENIENLKYNCDYGSLYVNKGNTIKGDGDYLSMKFGKIYKNIIINADYGSIRIAEMQENFESVIIESDYTGVKIGVAVAADFNIVANLSYGGFSYDGNFTFNKKNVRTTSKSYQGYHNTKNTESIIKINTDYGSVKLFEN